QVLIMRTVTGLLLLVLSLPALALSIFSCEPEWGALAKELAGEQARIYVATTALQDPHRIEARPSLIARARSADLVVCAGAELEASWLPLVLSQSGNARIQAGQPGYFEAAAAAELREKPASLDRAMGDVHAAGNPHLHLDPRNVAKVAAALAQRMAEIDPERRRGYEKRLQDFSTRWQQAVRRWEAQAAPLRGMPVIVQHRNFSYLVAWLGLREVAALEPKPGLPPGTAHLAEVLERHKRDPAKAVLRAAYDDPRPSEWLAARAAIRPVVLPYTVGGTPEAKDLFSLYEDTLSRLVR
ncbi:MAG TPA: zinc ABC transporter substrate-binding protein, partial [Burkholderiales bacterium]